MSNRAKDTRDPRTHKPRVMDRRRFLWEAGGGLGGVALSWLLHRDRLLAATPAAAPAVERYNPFAAKPPLFAPRAKRVIVIFCPGGVSHVDTYDYKPELVKRAGKPFDDSGKLEFFASKPGNCVPSYWKFRQHGQSGLWMSDLLPNLAGHVDDIAFIHSMHSKSAVHGPAMFMMNTGFVLPGFPSMGSWVTYGLGSETEDLPAFVVLPHYRGVPPGGPQTWGPGFLPAVYQGTVLNTKDGEAPVADLFPPDAAKLDAADTRLTRNALRAMNERFARQHPADTELEARIASYELAARLQLSVPEATDTSSEPAHVRSMYGLDDKREPVRQFGRQCLLARRMIERGVRFVQVWCGADNTPPPRWNWDGHENMVNNHGRHGPALDVGASALLADLKQRGLLDDTLVICTTEFGRQPAAEKGAGRDHNPHAFTAWLAGGGVKGGVAYGETDELGYKAVVNPAYSYELHATALHLLGLDHEQLTYYHNGLARRLTDVHGHVLDEIIA
jgi:hypothetical protein